MKALAARDIHVNISYPWPVHTMKGYAHLGGRAGDLPRTEAAANEIFSLPMYPTLTEAEQDFVCESLREILRREI
jgi:aminotransferase EvaB